MIQLFTNEVHVSDTFVLNLNTTILTTNQDNTKVTIVKIGIPTYAESQPVYYTDKIIIEDSDYTERSTEYTYKITLTDEELENP